MARQSISKDVLLDGTQMALAGLLAGIMSFLKERGIPIKDWVGYIGQQFDGALVDMEGESVEYVMSHLLTFQVLPLGAEVVSSTASDDKAEVVLTSLPSSSVLKKFGTTPRELLGGFKVTPREFASIYAMYEPAAEAIGLRFTHEFRDGKQYLRLEKAALR